MSASSRNPSPRRPKIGVLLNTYQRKFGMHSGGIIHALEVAKRWRDVDVTLFAPSDAIDELRNALPSAEIVAMPQFTRLPWRLEMLARGVLGVAKRGALRKMDGLFCSSHFIADVLPAALAKPNRSMTTVHHLVAPPWRRQGNSFSNAIGWAAQAGSMLIAKIAFPRFAFGADSVREEAAWFIKGKEVFMSTNGFSRPEDVPCNNGPRQDAIYVGRLDVAKRVSDLVAVWKRVARESSSWNLHIIGDGPQREELHAMIREHHLENRITLHGRLSDTEKWRLLERSALFVFPSSEEGWGIALAEAMAAGLPCVTYDLPVYRGIFDHARYAAPVGDVQRFGDICLGLIRDRERLPLLSGEARTASLSYSWQRAADIEKAALTKWD